MMKVPWWSRALHQHCKQFWKASRQRILFCQKAQDVSSEWCHIMTCLTQANHSGWCVCQWHSPILYSHHWLVFGPEIEAHRTLNLYLALSSEKQRLKLHGHLRCFSRYAGQKLPSKVSAKREEPIVLNSNSDLKCSHHCKCSKQSDGVIQNFTIKILTSLSTQSVVYCYMEGQWKFRYRWLIKH